MPRSCLRAGLLAAAALTLQACGSSRFGEGPGGPVAAVPSRSGPVYNAPQVLEPVEAVPAPSVSSAPLPPPPGAAGAAIDPGVPAADGPIIADVPATPAPTPVAIQPAAPAAPPSPSRSNVVGGWTARDATGGSCRVQLSSTPALDLYRATAANCPNRDLARVTAWDFRDGEVYLYQPGGAVAARLRAAGGSLDGVLAKSGAPLTLAR